jgi:hypothetical protein
MLDDGWVVRRQGRAQPQVVDGPRRETVGINTKKWAAARRIVISPDM